MKAKACLTKFRDAQEYNTLFAMFFFYNKTLFVRTTVLKLTRECREKTGAAMRETVVLECDSWNIM